MKALVKLISRSQRNPQIKNNHDSNDKAYTEDMKNLKKLFTENKPVRLYAYLQDKVNKNENISKVEKILMQCLGMIQQEKEKGFEYSEHVVVGEYLVEEIQNYFSEDLLLKDGKIQLPNGFQWNMSTLCALGDFFEPTRAISKATSDKEQEELFNQGFDFLYKKMEEGEENELKATILIGAIEHAAVIIAQNNGVSPDVAIHDLRGPLTDAWQEATTKRYLEALARNMDHFTPHNQAAYKAGHRAARNELEGLEKLFEKLHKSENETEKNETQKEIQLKIRRCLWKELYGVHYLMDMFSGGHVRVPREELYDLENWAWAWHTYVTGGLASYMHKEDGTEGIYVVNQKKEESKKERWLTYGDSQLFTEKGEETLKYLKMAAKESIRELIGIILEANKFSDAFKQETFPKFKDTEELFPVEDPTATQNHTPLFKVVKDEKGNKIVRCREDLFDIHCEKHTDDWWVLTTLYKLYYCHGLPLLPKNKGGGELPEFVEMMKDVEKNMYTPERKDNHKDFNFSKMPKNETKIAGQLTFGFLGSSDIQREQSNAKSNEVSTVTTEAEETIKYN